MTMLPIATLSGLLGFTEAGEEETINPVLPVSFEIVWSAIFFLALLALMKYVLLPPILEGREQRAARVTAGQDSVSESESELAQIVAAHNERIAAAKADGAAILDAARTEAEARRAQAVASVEVEISKLRSNAQAEIDSARVSAMTASKDAVSHLAVDAAAKVLGRNVDPGANQPVIDAYLSREH